MQIMFVWLGSITAYYFLSRLYLYKRGPKERAFFTVLLLVPTISFYSFLPGLFQVLPLGVSIPGIFGAGTFSIVLNTSFFAVSWGVLYGVIVLISDKASLEGRS